MTKIQITYGYDPRTNPTAPFFAYGRGVINGHDSLYNASSANSFGQAKARLLAKIRADQTSSQPVIPPEEEIDV